MKLVRSLLVALVLLVSNSAYALDVPECKGAVEPSVPGGCSGITYEGCCDQFGRVLWCKEGDLFCIDCAGQLPFCGWKPGGYYDCGAAEGAADPSGDFPYACQGCNPLCLEGVDCSPECSGQCGSCPEGEICLESGLCYTPQCEGKECGSDPFGFSCGTCSSGTECVEGPYKCLALPDACVPTTSPGCGGCDCESCVCKLYPQCCEENWDIFCTAACEFECDFDCSPCPEEPSCAGIECGEYCGVDCGSCPGGATCFQAACCQPDCEGKECGNDGCGGECGACPGTDVCDAGICMECHPACEGKECGPDGCEGSCGQCGEGEECVGGICAAGETCAGSCGGESQTGNCFCDSECFNFGDCCDDVCVLCVDDFPEQCAGQSGCQGVTWEGCCIGQLLKYCEGNELKEMDCTEQPVCGWNAEQSYYACETEGAAEPDGVHPMDCADLCEPLCEGKECGGDGCGGSCGECGGKGSLCTPSGQCCIPSCADKECGGNGCGGNCGDCAEGLYCSDGVCGEGIPGGCEVSGEPGCGGCACEECVFAVDPFCQETQWDNMCVQECQQCGTECPCTPVCEDVECGNDGCGGSCGECGEGGVCQSGQCVESECGGVPWEGCCDGETLTYCEGGGLVSKDCPGDGPCGWKAQDHYYDCGTDGGEDPAGEFPFSCAAYCVPDCEGKGCGDDGCEGSCGECKENELCIDDLCVEDECGEVVYEGCCDGHKLVWCEGGELKEKDCEVMGLCGWQEGAGYYNCATDGGEDPSGTFAQLCPGGCPVDCAARECGDDGCGGSCGDCGEGLECADGVCGAPAVEHEDIVATDLPTADAAVAEDSPPLRKGGGGCATSADPLSAGPAALLMAGLLLLIAGVCRRKMSVAAVCVAAAVFLGGCPGSGGTSGSPEVLADADPAADVADAASDGRPPDVSSDSGGDAGDLALETDDDLEAPDVQPDEVEQLPPFDCENIPPGPFELVEVPGAIASEDLAFDSQGHLVGSDNHAIYKTNTKGKVKLFAPNVEFRSGMRYLPNGSLAVNDNYLGRVLVFDPDGVMKVLVQGLSYPNGMTVDMQGFLYVTEHDAHRVLRIHSYTGEYEVLTTEIYHPNGITFNVDYSALYIGSFGSPWVYIMSLSEDGIPGRAEEWADFTDTPGLLDGMGVDICGNVYVCEYGDTDIWRVSPDGKIKEKIIDADESWTYLPNMQWGVGGGWDPYSLYIPDGWNIAAWRAKIGVPGKPRPFP